MTHWTEFLTFAVCHAEAMKYTQIALDPMQMVAVMQQAQQQARSFDRVIQGPFDSRLIASPR
jgi:hypothetical protein